MPWVKVGASDATQSPSGTSLNRTRTAGAVGNLIIISFLQSVRTNAATISDTQTNTWLSCNPDLNDATNASRTQSWYCHAKNTSSTTITVASNSAAGFITMTLDEFGGGATSAALDKHTEAAAGSSGANPVSSAIVLALNDELVWSWIGASPAPSPGAIDGTTATQGADDANNDETEYRILVGRGGASITAAWTMTAGSYNMNVASFKPAVSGVAQTMVRPFPFAPSGARGPGGF